MLTTALTAPVVAAAAAADPVWRGPWGFGFPWFLVFIPLFWLVVLGLFFAFVGRRWRRGGPWGSSGPNDGYGVVPARGAEATLAERFAQGDIDEVEYRARLEVLRANRPTG